MTLRARLTDLSTLIRVGAACFILFHLSHWLLHPVTSFWRGFVDGMGGVAFGIGAGCFLLAARLKSRRRAGKGNLPCA